MPARVTCWQSYSSSRSKPRQFSRCSSAASVTRRQLSSSSTRSLSCPHVLLLRCRIPSSVMSSQWDKLWGGKKYVPSEVRAGESVPQVPLSNCWLWCDLSSGKHMLGIGCHVLGRAPFVNEWKMERLESTKPHQIDIQYCRKHLLGVFCKTCIKWL